MREDDVGEGLGQGEWCDIHKSALVELVSWRRENFG